MAEEIPAELQFDFEFGNLTQDQKTQMLDEYNAKRAAGGEGGGGESQQNLNQQNNGEGGNGGGDQDQNNNGGQASQDQQQTPIFDFKKFGDDIEDEETLKALLESGRTFKQKQKEIEEVFETASQLKENPIPEKFRSLVNFYKEYGIDDDQIARKVTSLNKESIQNDPLSVLTAKYILDNKELAETGWDAMYKFVARENNIDLSTDLSELSDEDKQVLTIKATQAMSKMQENLEKLGKSEDFYTSLQQRRDQTATQVKERQEAWKPHVKQITEELAKGVSVKVKSEKYGDIEFPIAIGEGDSKNIIKSLSGFISNMSPDEKGIKQLKDAIVATATSGESKLAELFSSAMPILEERMTGVILKELKQKQANGQDIFVANRANPVSNASKSMTLGEALDQFNANN